MMMNKMKKSDKRQQRVYLVIKKLLKFQNQLNLAILLKVYLHQDQQQINLYLEVIQKLIRK